ncbi:sulfate transporter [Mycobacterium yunnanensis]|uniref:Sulfate transporter n=1 Tax=Mycobacterium yunnanensis TaxID=368477 RepID=A0A9X3BT45_9MYCO|nr:sulfate transporter [Mycobacterium yunnanensis]MCV7421279.1 sulfate transporter [Mycobacterium yunnanensis]
MHPSRSPLTVDVAIAPAAATVVLGGVLDATTYLVIRDAVVKAALDAPMVLVDVTALHAPSPSAWAVFTSARWLVVDWPNVPIGLVCAHTAVRRVLARNGITRYLPVYGTATAARSAMASNLGPLRQRARDVWPATPTAVAPIRDFVTHRLCTWSLSAFAPTACVVATVLVENVLQHTDSDLDVRVEAGDDTVTVAVTDGSPSLALIHEDDELLGALTQLQIVDALTRVWGNTPVPGGKVVWGVIGPENRL